MSLWTLRVTVEAEDEATARMKLTEKVPFYMVNADLDPQEGFREYEFGLQEEAE